MSHSVEKSRNLTQRAFSAGNLITHKTSKKTPCEMNDLQANCLKEWVICFEENPKFGLAYMTNTKKVGFRFNDQSAMISDAKLTKVKFWKANLKKK